MTLATCIAPFKFFPAYRRSVKEDTIGSYLRQPFIKWNKGFFLLVIKSNSATTTLTKLGKLLDVGSSQQKATIFAWTRSDCSPKLEFQAIHPARRICLFR